jgi:hypothetical protein
VSDSTEVRALIERLCGVAAADAVRAVEVSNAQIAALAWIREATGTYPVAVSAKLQEVADELRRSDDDRNPREVLLYAAVAAVRGRDSA